MGEHTKKKPKSLVEIKPGVTLFSYQVETLVSMGIKDIVITTGYLDDILKKYAMKNFPDIEFVFIHNPLYASTNYIKSLDIAAEQTKDDIILIHGDLYFDKTVLESLILNQTSSVVIDSTLPLPDKDFKARIEGNKIIEISTSIFGSDCVACQPLYKLNKDDWHIWQEEIKNFCKSGNTKVYAEEAFNVVSKKINLQALDIKGKTCMEVDNGDDLELLKSILI